jgi:lycopene beta-cyclase
MSNTFDFIILGGGLAGQSLAWHLLQGPLRGKRIALVEAEAKRSNDRTWCFWEQAPGPFDNIVYHRWDRLDFFSEPYSGPLDIAPFQYKMIRGLDFYQFLESEFSQSPNVERINGKVQSWRSTPDGVEALLEDGSSLRGAWGFSSIPAGPVDKERYNYLDQHFKGWVIRTAEPVFDPASATFMDFRVPQDQGLSFLYTLPTDRHTALVELTFFSNKLFSSDEYDRMLKELIPQFVTRSAYEIEHTEMGAIPMTDFPFPRSEGRMAFIGTAGGHTKASSGYTFWRLQKNLMKMVRQLERTGSPFPLPPIAPARFGLFDSTLLNVLGKGELSGGEIFGGLFKRNPPARVLRFLNEETSMAEDLRIMSSVPIGPFLRGFAESLF